MAVLEGILTGTGDVPSFGGSLLDLGTLRALAAQLMGKEIPMLLDHDIDQPLTARILSASVIDGKDGEHLLHASWEIPDEQLVFLGDRRGMSIGFPRPLIVPEAEPTIGVYVDTYHYSRADIMVVTERLDAQGFVPVTGAYFQLAEIPPAAVVIELLQHLPGELPGAILAAGIFEGVKVLLHREHKTRFRFRWKAGDESIVAEVETSSEKALREALRGLDELVGQSGTFKREIRRKKWRKAGAGQRRSKGGAGH
jgi:hypothetical protein